MMNNSKSKILFIILDNYKTERLGIQILSSIALEEGYRRKLLILSSFTLEDALVEAQAFQPQIVAYSAMTFEQFELQKFNRQLKYSGLQFISIFGGHHYTLNPEEIHHDENIDIVCRGEGEAAFRSFIKAVRDGRPYHLTEKLWVRQGEEVIQNPLGLLIKDLDTIPFPDRNLLPPAYLTGGGQIYGRSISVMFTRGCPHRCTYCFYSVWNSLFQDSPVIRHRSVDNIIKELKQLVNEYDPDLFYIWDDDFSLFPRKTIKVFCQRYKKEIKKPFSAHFRATTIDENLISILKEAGLAIATTGVECGDEQTAKDLLGRGELTNTKLINTFRIFNKYGIRNYSQNIMSLPVENPLEVDLKTIQLNIQCKPTIAHFYILLPYPKTLIWRYAVQHGYLDKDAFRNTKKMPSVYTTSRLNYKDHALANKINNLHKFASIVVKFPFLLPLVKILIRLPPNRAFQYLYFVWYGYWNAVGLFNTKLSGKLIFQGIKAIKGYLRNH